MNGIMCHQATDRASVAGTSGHSPLLAVHAVSTYVHGWSFFGKVGGAKMILADSFCANTVKISLGSLKN